MSLLNISFMDEALDANLFNLISEAQMDTDLWVTDYIKIRPHESLGYKTPTEFRPRIFKSGMFISLFSD